MLWDRAGAYSRSLWRLLRASFRPLRKIFGQRLASLTLATIILVWQLAGWPRIFNFPAAIPKAKAASITVTLTSGTTWTVPPAWDNTNNVIEAIGAGGNGATSSASTYAGAGGGGGEYRQAANVALTPNATLTINIPAGGAGSTADGAWLKNSSGTKVIEAKNGANASGTTGGAGGSGGIGATLNYSGGTGGAGSTGAEGSAGGGGGSAGPSGVGRNGGAGAGGVGPGGGGGGGSNGGASTAGGIYSGTSGGPGGNGYSGTGGGAAGTKNGADAGVGTVGGGGGGGGEGTGTGTVPGAAGGIQDLWSSGIGPSGGGGGGGGAGGTGASGNHSGGAGGAYGGGGGGGGLSGSHTNPPGTGGQGLLVITYTPSVPPAITQSDYRLFNNPSSLGTTPWMDCQTESGETTIAGGLATSTATLATPISDLTQAFLMVSYSGDTNVTNSSDHMIGGVITNSNTLTFTRGAASSGTAQIGYSVVQCYNNEFSVQRGQTAIASGGSSATATITSVDTTKSMVLVSGYNDDATATEQTGLATGELQNSSTVLLKRNSAPTVNATMDWQVVTFSAASGASVQTGETTLASGTASTTATISAVNTAASWLYCSYDADTGGLQQDAVGCDLTNSSTLTFNRYASGAYNNRIRWYVVSFPSADVSVQRGGLVDGGGTTDGVRYDIEIPLTNTISSTNKAFAFITNTTSGTGTAFPRNDWIYQLTTTSNLETSYWRGATYGAGTHYWQVIEFLQAPTDVGTPLAAENTAASLAATGRTFRLRLLLGVSNATVAQGTAFKLQYAALSGSCAASTYTDVTSSSPVAFKTFHSLSSGTPMTTNANDPVDGSNTTDPQTYMSANNFVNDQSLISPGQDGEWDFSLVDNSAPANTTYCFRAVNASGSTLDAYSYYPQITTSDGVFGVDIVNSGGASVSSPTAAMSAATKSLSCTTTSGTLGTSSERLRITNHSANIPWSLSIAATGGNTSLWSDGSAFIDYNDPSGSPPGCAAGADSDVYAGVLSLLFGSASLSPSSGCSATGVTLGSNAQFSEGVTDSLTIGSASSAATNGCYWDLQNIGLQQTIPAGQPAGNYNLNLTLTLVAN